MSIETFLVKYPELKEVANTYLVKLISDLLGLNNNFCHSSVYFSMRMMKYDQTVGMFIKDDDLFNYYIRGCGDLVEFPRGMILHSKENKSIAACVTLNFMKSHYYIPLEIVDEIPVRQHNSLKKIYKLKRTSGKIQNCILGNNHSIFLKSYYNQNSEGDLSNWRIRVLFNDIEDGNEEVDNKKLEVNNTTYEKCICIKEFCELNDISKITFNVSKLKNHVYLLDEICSDYEQDSSDSLSASSNDYNSNNLSAVYNKDGSINKEFVEHSVNAKKYVIDYYISQLDTYVQTILPHIRKKINIDII